MVEPLTLRRHFGDNLQNVISGLGTYKDKTVATQYVFSLLDVQQLEFAYRGDWIARKVVDIPAQDSTRMWREWQAEKEQITKIEDLEREHDIQGKVNRAMTLARLYGGAALIIGVDGAGTEKQELNLERVKEGSLKFVHAVHRWELGASEYDFDLKSKNYRLPLYYTVRSSQGESLDVHWSRVIRFIGSPIPDPAQCIDGWGDSILQSVDTAIKGAGIVIGGIAALVQEAKIDVIKIPNLSERLSTKEYADKLSQRMTYTNVIKSMNNALLIDAAEDWERISTSFASLPDILQNYLICAAGAADIPATRLIGQSPKGLNATGEHDTRNYYDKIKSEQNTILRPAMSTLDEVLIRSALGSRDEDIFYEWNSLWQMNETEKAALAKAKADTFVIDVNTGLIDSNALRIGRENQLIEDGTYPGLEQTLADQEAGEIPTQEEQFAHDPEMNPDHPQNVAAQQTAEAQAKEAQFHAKNPLAAIKAKANGKGNPFGKKKTTDFNPNHDPSTGEFSSGSGGGGGSPAEEDKWASRWETAKKVGNVALTVAMYGLAAWAIYRQIKEASNPAAVDERARILREAMERIRAGHATPGVNVAPLLQNTPSTIPFTNIPLNSPGFGGVPPSLPPGQKYLPPTNGPSGPGLQGTDPTLRPGDPSYTPGRDPSTVPRPEYKIDPSELPPPRNAPRASPASPVSPVPDIPKAPTGPAGPGNPDWDFPDLPPVKKRKFEPYVPDAGRFQLAKADVNVLARYFDLTPELKQELASLTFSGEGELIGKAAAKDSTADDGLVDDLDDGLEEALAPQQAPPHPVVITNVMPSASPAEVSAQLVDAVTQAVLKALRSQPINVNVKVPEPHGGKVKRIVRDVEHDKDGKIKRITDTEE